MNLLIQEDILKPILALTAFLFFATTPVQAEDSKGSGIYYPQRIDFEAGHVIVHAPQISSWEDFSRVTGHAALEGHRSTGGEPLYASAEFSATTLADVDRRIVTVSDLVISEIKFADGGVMGN